MNKRKLGKTGEMLSMVGFGGIVVMNEEQSSANRIVARAVEERGLNYFDVAPSYGNAEEILGPALEPYRSSVFLACKTGKRTASEAKSELHQSLRRMRTDHFDLYQLHGVRTMDEVEQIVSPGGALETFIQAREQGLTRYLGFSAHSEEAALALMDHYDFDSVLFPFNYVSWYEGNFGPRVLEKAMQKNMGVLALKSLAKRRWQEGEERRWPKCWYSPVDTPEEAAWGLRFTLSRPITAAVSPSHAELLWWACDAADQFVPLLSEDEVKVAEMAKGLAAIFPQDYK